MKELIDFYEAKEMQNAKAYFPHAPQIRWLSKRDNKMEGEHYNLIQLSFNVKIDENGFSFDYQISIHFELEEQKQERDVIIHKVKKRLSTMKIKNLVS